MKLRSNQQGYTLLELIVGVGLGCLLVVFLARQFGLSFTFDKHVAGRYDLLQMSHDIEQRIDCKRLPSSCPLGKSVTVFQKKDGAVLIEADRSTKIKGWNLAAECGSQNQILIRVAQIGPTGAFVKDPLTLQLLDWKDKRGILLAEGLICPSSSMAPMSKGFNTSKIISGEPCFTASKFEACSPPAPPDCGLGFVSIGTTLDAFGGEGTETIRKPIYGRRWIQYCSMKT